MLRIMSPVDGNFSNKSYLSYSTRFSLRSDALTLTFGGKSFQAFCSSSMSFIFFTADFGGLRPGHPLAGFLHSRNARGTRISSRCFEMAGTSSSSMSAAFLIMDRIQCVVLVPTCSSYPFVLNRLKRYTWSYESITAPKGFAPPPSTTLGPLPTTTARLPACLLSPLCASAGTGTAKVGAAAAAAAVMPPPSPPVSSCTASCSSRSTSLP
mmetsp:Transcript_25620/g.64121  ORF Transcript_25620/g.64121 Transcript_25620/m.64121 type:complete len:210 (-) Transcript_25620:267-896(-)